MIQLFIMLFSGSFIVMGAVSLYISSTPIYQPIQTPEEREETTLKVDPFATDNPDF